MNDAERTQYEKEIAVAVLVLWIFFDSEIQRVGRVDYNAFKSVFEQHLRPKLAVVYGSARNDLANRFGVQYTSRQTSEGNVVTIPNLNRVLDSYMADLYESFARRATVNRQAQDAGEAPTPYGEGDAERWAVTNVTSARAVGQIDAAADVEARVGTRLVAYWKTEPGACPKCAALEGQPWRVWRLVFPEGPPAHPHCRCDLIWRELLE